MRRSAGLETHGVTNHQHAQRKNPRKTVTLRCKLIYFTISRFFQRRFLLRHLRHLTADPAFLAPHSRQIFMYNLCCCAIDFLNGSVIGIASSTRKQTRSHTPHKQITFSMQYLESPYPAEISLFFPLQREARIPFII